MKAEQGLAHLSSALLNHTVVKPEASNICDYASSGAGRIDLQKLLSDDQILLHQNQSLLHDNQRLDYELCSMLRQNQDLASKVEQLQATIIDLSRQNDELRRKYSKKVERYEELDKNYMELVRHLHVSDDDYSTVYNRMVHLRVSIETMIQKAKGYGSVNLHRKAAIAHFKKAGLTQDFPVEEHLLEPYHLNLYMESAVMTVLIDHFFNNFLGCIFNQSEEFQKVNKWVEKRDEKIATRWRQQLCLLVVRESQAMKSRREKEVCRAANTLCDLVYKVYRGTDMSVKIRELCFNAFDLSLAMYGMEAVIHPVTTPLGTPFDSTTMVSPQKSNPEGKVFLVIFPTFKDKNDFFIKSKVWCY